jgi:hypothetical protein
MVEACIRAAKTAQTINLNVPTAAAEPVGASLHVHDQQQRG